MLDDGFGPDPGLGREQVGVLRPVLGGAGEVGGVRERYGYLLRFLVVRELGERVREPVWERVGDWASVAKDEFFAWVPVKSNSGGNGRVHLPSMSTACPEAREQRAPVESMKNTWSGRKMTLLGRLQRKERSLLGYPHPATEDLEAEWESYRRPTLSKVIRRIDGADCVRTLDERLFFGGPEADRSVINRVVSEDVEEATGCDGFDGEVSGWETQGLGIDVGRVHNLCVWSCGQGGRGGRGDRSEGTIFNCPECPGRPWQGAFDLGSSSRWPLFPSLLAISLLTTQDDASDTASRNTPFLSYEIAAFHPLNQEFESALVESVPSSS